MKTSGRVLAFDWGLRNIGVAVGNRILGTCEPLTIIPAQNGSPDWGAVEQLLTEWQPEILVVGEPLNMDGSEADITPRARRFSRQLEGRFTIPVVLVDERLSTHEAKSAAKARGHKGDYSRQPIDAQAAEVILRSWLTAIPR